jgi:4-amino-4-deoxy-L-arabinose transferase-like glycosyltransferase
MSETRDPKTIRRLSAVALLVAVLQLFVHLGDLPLVSPDEGRNAAVAREMKVSGAWLVPSYNGMPYLDKPAFYFKTVALSFAAFGESEWAARLPSALCALGILLLLYIFCRRVYRKPMGAGLTPPGSAPAGLAPAGLAPAGSAPARPWLDGGLTAPLAVLVVVTSPAFMVFARWVIFDMPLAFFVLLSIVAAFVAEEVDPHRRRLWWALAAVAAGLATLIKGPVGFIVPGLVVLVNGLVRGAPAGQRQTPRRRLRVLGSMLAPLNILLFFAVTLPWFLGLVHRQPDFLHYGLVEETFRRYSTTAFHRTAPFYYYGPVLLGIFFPWSVLLPESIAAAWQTRRSWARADRMLIVCALVVVAFFSTSQSKLAGYILAGVIALGVLIARVFAHALRYPTGRGARIVRRGGLILAATCLAGGLMLLLSVIEPEWMQAFLRIRSTEFDRFQPAFLPLALILFGLAALAALAWWWRRPGLTFAVFASFSLALVTADFGGLRSYAEASSSKSLAHAIPDGVPVAALEYFSTGLPFYLRRPVVLITRDGHEMTSNYLVYRLGHERVWPEGVVPYEQRESWLDGRTTPVFLLTGKRGRAELQRLAGEREADVCEIGPNVWGTLLRPLAAPRP